MFNVEPMTGIEPAYSASEVDAHEPYRVEMGKHLVVCPVIE